MLLPLECLPLTFVALSEAGRSRPLGLFCTEQLGLTPAFPRFQNEFHAELCPAEPPRVLSVGCRGP